MKPNHGLDFSTTRGPCNVHGPAAYLDRQGRCTACLTLGRRNCGTCGQAVVGSSCHHCHGCLVPWHPRHTGSECPICAKNADAFKKVVFYGLQLPAQAVIVGLFFGFFASMGLYAYGVFKTFDALITLYLLSGGAVLAAMVWFWWLPAAFLGGATLFSLVEAVSVKRPT